MRSLIRPQSNMFAIQRILAAFLFGLIFSAYLFAYLLYLYPAVTVFWQVSVPLNHLMQPVTVPIDSLSLAGPKLLLLIFLILTIAPLTAVVRRSWLATASAGHAALAVGILVLAGNFMSALDRPQSASLLPATALRNIGLGTWGIAATTALLIAFCVLNHIAFFRAARQQ